MSSIKIDYRPELYNPPRNCPLKIGTVALMPGMDNEVDANVWDALKKNPRLPIEDLIEIGIIREIRPAKARVAKPVEFVAPVSKIEEVPELETETNNSAVGVPGSNTEALNLIQETTDISTLEAWLAGETRSRVKSALNRRITSLKITEPVEV